MISVEQLIGELLLRHNCVIIPSFGGFVAKQSSASIDYKNGVMTPPRKSLLFNRQLINNDGLLIAELAVSNSIQYNEATSSVGDLVKDWNEKLRNGERITIDKVGFLFFDQEKNICFEQDRFFNLLLESYGLEKVHFLSESDVQFAQKTIIERSINEESEHVIQAAIVFNTETIALEERAAEKKIIEHPALKSKTKIWKYVAAACLLPIAFYSFWLPMKTDVLESGMISIKDFNPFYKSGEGTYKSTDLKAKIEEKEYTTLDQSISKLPEDVTVFYYKYDEDLYIPVRITNTTVVENSVVENPTEIEIPVSIKAPVASTKKNSKFELIVGCFGSETNATNLVATLKAKGIPAYIYDVSNGLNRVSAGNAGSEKEMQGVIQNAAAQGFEGWVLKK